MFIFSLLSQTRSQVQAHRTPCTGHSSNQAASSGRSGLNGLFPPSRLCGLTAFTWHHAASSASASSNGLCH